MIAPARRRAVEALHDIRESRATLPDALAALRQRLTDPRDTALASEIVIGTQRWLATLDYYLAALSSRPIGRVDPDVLDVLRASAYQLLHLDRVPASAVVNDAVALTRELGYESASGFVNALMRRLSSPGSRPRLPEAPDSPERLAEHLALTLSHPRWLVVRWLERLGPETTTARLKYDQSAGSITLRLPAASRERTLAALEAAGVHTEPAAHAPGALRVVAGSPWKAGLVPGRDFVVQDEASQLVAYFAAPAPGNRVLDVCASPGGKTTLMAELMDGSGLLVAGDVREARVDLLRRVVADSGVRRVAIVGHDGLAGLPYGAVFDLVLVDAPCSGLGTLRRDPDLKWHRRENDLPGLTTVERALLAESARVVKPGGRLVYATCSSEPDENEHVARAFLEGHGGFRPAPPPASWTSPPLSSLVTPEGWLQTVPERDGLDAFFAAAFTRVG